MFNLSKNLNRGKKGEQVSVSQETISFNSYMT
jgi:hypothetical protein